MGWGLHSHFFVQPNYSVEVVLRCVVVGVVTIIFFIFASLKKKLLHVLSHLVGDSKKIWGKLPGVLNQCDHTCKFLTSHKSHTNNFLTYICIKILLTVVLYFHE